MPWSFGFRGQVEHEGALINGRDKQPEGGIVVVELVLTSACDGGRGWMEKQGNAEGQFAWELKAKSPPVSPGHEDEDCTLGNENSPSSRKHNEKEHGQRRLHPGAEILKCSTKRQSLCTRRIQTPPPVQGFRASYANAVMEYNVTMHEYIVVGSPQDVCRTRQPRSDTRADTLWLLSNRLDSHESTDCGPGSGRPTSLSPPKKHDEKVLNMVLTSD
ncbi:hypothetical protein C8F04DRAFT_1299619 [Mycena alexandri]|uniref:Uncharacterized protein n=1 Tax=Mycena alexandri TaxID=1745969 RepID=A0AAD6SDK5_9AGAR|nr:hypothetical protein C8F04DRAFT_1299619 [Mycena alexandri]